MKYYNYNELKDSIIVNKDYQEKFRKQTDLERKNLKDDLIYHKRVLSPLHVRTSINGLVLVDGHHRFNLLPEVIEECPEFDLNIPVVVIKLEDVPNAMLRTQLGRRNLAPEDIKQYVDTLIAEDGLSANKAYNKVAEVIGKSEATIRRIHKPKQAQANRLNQSKRNSYSRLVNLTNSEEVVKSGEKERKLEQSRQNRINKKMEKVSSSWEGNLLDTKQLVEYEDKPYYDEVLANGIRYRKYTGQEDYLSTEEYISGASTNPNNPHTNVPEYERLLHIKEKIKDIEEHLPFFQDSPIHSDMFNLVSNYKSRLNSFS